MIIGLYLINNNSPSRLFDTRRQSGVRVRDPRLSKQAALTTAAGPPPHRYSNEAKIAN